MNARVYVSGALTNVPDSDRIEAFYEAIGDICREVSLDAYLPHQHSGPKQRPDLTPKQVFEKDKNEVRASDLLVAYVGIPSFGVGMELAYAESAGIPILLLCEQEKHISRFPLGIPTLVGEIRFSDFEEALRLLRVRLQAIKSQMGLVPPNLTTSHQVTG